MGVVVGELAAAAAVAAAAFAIAASSILMDLALSLPLSLLEASTLSLFGYGTKGHWKNRNSRHNKMKGGRREQDEILDCTTTQKRDFARLALLRDVSCCGVV